jgi:hypothetical protein
MPTIAITAATPKMMPSAVRIDRSSWRRRFARPSRIVSSRNSMGGCYRSRRARVRYPVSCTDGERLHRTDRSGNRDVDRLELRRRGPALGRRGDELLRHPLLGGPRPDHSKGLRPPSATVRAALAVALDQPAEVLEVAELPRRFDLSTLRRRIEGFDDAVRERLA